MIIFATCSLDFCIVEAHCMNQKSSTMTINYTCIGIIFLNDSDLKPESFDSKIGWNVAWIIFGHLCLCKSEIKYVCHQMAVLAMDFFPFGQNDTILVLETTKLDCYSLYVKGWQVLMSKSCCSTLSAIYPHFHCDNLI